MEVGVCVFSCVRYMRVCVHLYFLLLYNRLFKTIEISSKQKSHLKYL